MLDDGVTAKRIAFAFPTVWDHRQLASCRDRWVDLYEPQFLEPSAEDFEPQLDLLDFIDHTAQQLAGRIEGVTSSSDYPGATVAAALATRLGLPGSRPEAVLAASHKYYSRRTQLESAPEAVPRFALVDSRRPEATLEQVPFPCFVKPVKGAFSVLSRRIDDRDELVAFLRQPAVAEFTGQYLAPFDRLLAHFTRWEVGAPWFLAEELLTGTQATVEGWVQDGQVELLGIVDSTFHPEIPSFLRFDYPSALPAPVQRQMEEISRRVVQALGLEGCLFNLEMIHDPGTGRTAIIEVNPRPCGQFADLYDKVDGRHGGEVAFALAAGQRPPPHRRPGSFRCAASFPLRVFEPSRVLRAPDDGACRELEARFPGTLIWRECAAGQELADFERFEDGFSARYAVINLGADSRGELTGRSEAVREALGFAFEPLA